MIRLLRTTATAAFLLSLAGGAAARDWGGMYVPLDEKDLELLSGAADRLDAQAGADQPVAWENAANGTRGAISVGRRFEHEGTPCVQYRLRIEVSGYEPFVSTPVMCNAGDEWRLMSKKS